MDRIYLFMNLVYFLLSTFFILVEVFPDCLCVCVYRTHLPQKQRVWYSVNKVNEFYGD